MGQPTKMSKQDFMKTTTNAKTNSNNQNVESDKKEKSTNSQILQTMKNVNENQSKMTQILEGMASKMGPKSNLINQKPKTNDPTEVLPKDRYIHLLQMNEVITNKLKALQDHYENDTMIEDKCETDSNADNGEE